MDQSVEFCRISSSLQSRHESEDDVLGCVEAAVLDWLKTVPKEPCTGIVQPPCGFIIAHCFGLKIELLESDLLF
jgi:hypothetical protein